MSINRNTTNNNINNEEHEFHVLKYKHEKIQKLLEKIDAAYVLNETQYNHLRYILKIYEVDTLFSGDYNDLINKPDIPKAEDVTILQNNQTTLMNTINNFITKVENKYSTKEDMINADKELEDKLLALLETKVEKEDGKGLSANDLTDELHALLKEIIEDADNDAKRTLGVLPNTVSKSCWLFQNAGGVVSITS